jgi:hypothetical protein
MEIRKIQENQEMVEDLNQLGKMIKMEIRERAKRELDSYVKELLK